MKFNFFITKHCRERYLERVKLGDNSSPKGILNEMLDNIHTGKDVTSKIYDSTPRYILYLYEKYGKLGITIVEAKDVIYICNKRPGTANLYDVLTCYNSHRHLEQFKNTALSRQEVFIRIKEIKRKLQ